MNAETKLSTLYRIGNRIPLNKSQAAGFVGGRYRLEKLIRENKIRATNTGATKMSPYDVNACDVFLYAIDSKEQRI